MAKRKKISRAKPRKPKKAVTRRTTAQAAAASPARKPRKTMFDLPPLELECMKAVWAQDVAEAGNGEKITVREIREVVARNHRRLAYTTVETIMDRLTRKGVVRRQKQGRAHHYTAVYQLKQARAEGVQTLLNHFFGGSRRALQAYMAGTPVNLAPSRRPMQALSSPSRRGASKPASARKEDSPIDTSLL